MITRLFIEPLRIGKAADIQGRAGDMSRAGRKRKINADRRPDGKPRQPIVDNLQQVARQRMQHHGLSAIDARSDLGGYPLGRLWASKRISERLHEIGTAWAKLRWRYGQIMGIMLPMSRCIDWQGPGGRSLADEPDPEEIGTVKTSMHKAIKALSFHTPTIGMIDRVCVADEDPEDVSVLQRGLLALSKSRGWQ